MLITMLADRFEAGGVLRAKGTQVDVATDLALRWIGDGVAAAVGNSRETSQGLRKDVDVVQDRISGQQFAGDAPVSGAGNRKSARVRPYRWATLSDSRETLNITNGSASVSGSGNFIRLNRPAGWFVAARGDSVICFNGGVSGDILQNALDPARADGRNINALLASSPNGVLIQFGINNIIGWNGAQADADLLAFMVDKAKGILTAVLGAGIPYAVWEECYPCTDAGFTGIASLVARKKAVLAAYNAQMKAHIESAWKGRAIYAPLPFATTATGELSPSCDSGDGVHTGGLTLGGRLIGESVASTSLALVPRLEGKQFVNSSLGAPSMVRVVSPQAFALTDNGTTSAITITSGQDDKGPWVKFRFTPLTLATGTWRTRLEIHANVGAFGGATPDFTVAVGDQVSGGADLSITNGNGGPSPVGFFIWRAQCAIQAGGSTQVDLGDFSGAGVIESPSTTPVSGVFQTLSHTLTVASAGIEAPAYGKGLRLVAILIGNVINGQDVEFTAYNPWLSKVLPEA